MESSKLLDILSIFQQAREKLTTDFVSENLEIYTAMFEYEKDNGLMNLSIEKYFTSYLDYHFELIKDFDNIDEEFSKAMLVFLKSFDMKITDTSLSSGTDLFTDLVNEKQRILNEMISIGNIDNSKYNKLSYFYQKDKAIFDREIDKLIKG